jgi:hypothetical protein
MIKKSLIAVAIIAIVISIALAAIIEVPWTGQNISYGIRDDGALWEGASWPDPRFKDNGNGTVTDMLTGLTWLRDANCFGSNVLSLALSACNNLSSGSCGLSDGSSAGDWRLPNVNELESLIDASRDSPALPLNHPFINVQTLYWSSTTYEANTSNAWYVDMTDGIVSTTGRGLGNYVWPVRGR